MSPAQNGLPSFEGMPAADVVSGHSLERGAAGIDTDDNAADFVDRPDPTPGYSPEPTPDPMPDPNPGLPIDAGPEGPSPVDPGPVDPLENPIPPASGKVVLNEIFYDAVGTDTDGVLFVELFGDAGKDVSNYKINFVDGADGSVDDSVVLPPDARLRSDGFYLIGDAKNGLPSSTNVAGADFIDNFDPANGPDAVLLLDGNGTFVDAVGYGDGILATGADGFIDFEEAAAPDVFNGHSLERREPGFDTDDNFNDFLDRETPTPGW
ncbi:MAG TPA: hypothetical protein VFX30_11670 [bacterium]|nr:hypothetical protein [bacterium]